MSDMDTPEVPETPAEPVAPEQPTADAVEAPAVPADAPEAGQITPDPTPNPEPTPEPVVLATPIASRAPSSASETQQPEAAPVVDAPPLPLADAVRVLIIFVKDHRTPGDSDLAAALADVEASLAAQDEA